ncbi:nudix (nucleoside diphosphate linked moiety X)-type motif 8 [Linnemannia hyalina]|uniref:Nudix (Nucleoside diphosphate linked moiety X)-type motif 8 n=1 Tax=Linnemannia hyalina TaxID=64524 RepID=A0A9P7XR76_9FUNG|nr:nudix (nucleoside diphosphate linked moiety X)-type motif 8 [Linnemannia hyalina]
MVMVQSATQQTLKRSARSAWTHLCTTASPRATSQCHHTGHLLHRHATGRLAVERLGGAREFSSSATAATARANTETTTTEVKTSTESAGPTGTNGAWSAKDPIQLDAPFLDMVRQRLVERDDTSAYFMHCKEDPVRQAGVFMPLCMYKGVPSVLFTVRAPHMRNHRGEVSFPGGKRDPTDTSVLDTALREMEEEIFISRDKVEVLGECAPLPNKGCTLKVHPFVGYIKEPIEDLDSIKFNKDEVQRVFTVPLQDLMNPEKRSMVQFRSSKFLYPVWKVDGEGITIWGLTAFIMDGVLRRIGDEGPTQAIEIPKGTPAGKYRPLMPSA